MQTPSRGGTLTVSELNRQARHLLEVSFMQVLVEGEISGFSRPSSGHWYFTLKDANAQVSCAMFRNRNQSVKTLPRDGDHVLVRAKVSLFEGRGNFQLLVEGLEPAGLGALQQAFEALKTRLAAEGLFDPARKRAIPALPHHVGIVTSPTGAAIHDILTVMRRRFPAIPVALFPTAVQGQAAADEIVRAVETANLHSDCDVLIVGRGGGSLEDLWPFNEERVARAIFHSRIPVISAVGHEVDVTIADFVADLRAPTPSAAAERVAPDQKAWRDQLAQYHERLLLGWRRQTRQHTLHLTQLTQRLRDPAHQLQELGQRLDGLEIRLGQAVRRSLHLRQQQAQHQQARLQAQSPQRLLLDAQRRIQDNTRRLVQAQTLHLERLDARLGRTVQTLHAVSPLATLGRGYAILQTRTGDVVRDWRSVATGDHLTARLGNGQLVCRVESQHPAFGDTQEPRE